MSDPYIAGAVVVGIVNVAAALVGLLQWALNRPGRAFWRVARAGQIVAALYAVFAGIYAVAAEPPAEGLAWVYILTPVAVSYFAEQLRIIAAQTVLERHGYLIADAQVRAHAPHLITRDVPPNPPHDDVADPAVAERALADSAKRRLLGRF